MINSTSLKHPKTQDRILSGLIIANDNAKGKGRGHAYVNNAKGNPMFRIDVIEATQTEPVKVVAWAGATQMQGKIEVAMGMPLGDLL